MPRGDGMGPRGMGPMTGRGAGYCIGAAAVGCAISMAIPGGFGRGRGRFGGYGRRCNSVGGFGRANSGYQYDEKAFLSNRIELLENQLDAVRMRLKELNVESE